MKLKCVIFDFDGTLFDSMYLWDTVAESYVRSRGKEPKPIVREEVRALSLLQAAEHLKKEYDLAETPEEIMAGIDRIIEHFYRDEVQPKPGVVPFLKELRAKGADVCIATGTTLCRITKEMHFESKGRKTMKTALSIAGSDSCGGAGIQADIKTMTMNGVYAMTAITALTAQNTTGVRAIQEATPAFLKEQLDAVFEDIFPDAVKIGMVSSSDLIRVIAERLRHYGAKNIVVDPVMVATSGSSLMKTDAVQTLIDELLPLSTVITPNIPEGEILSSEKIESRDDMERAAKRIGDTYGCAVLLKGGHRVNDANDLLYAGGEMQWFEGKRIDNPNTHGTGCTLSSAIASNLAKGYSLSESVARAKEYISGALSAMLDLGKGAGPMQHNFDLRGEFARENTK